MNVLLFVLVLSIQGAFNVYFVAGSSRFLKKVQSTENNEIAKNDIGCISRKNKLVYVHIPKTGGSTFEQSELFADAHDLANQGVRHGVGGHHSIWSMMIDEEERGLTDFKTAATVRHPCERFISAFRFVTSELCSQNEQILAKKLIGEKTIDEYVAYMEENEWNERMFVHLYEQHPFIMDEYLEEVQVDTILCEEHWKEGIERLESKIGISNVLPKLNNHEKRNKHETCADLEPETRSAIERYYAMDYCLFEYQSLPEKEGTCVGTNNNKETMTLKYKSCLEKLEDPQSDLKIQTKKLDYYY